MRKVLSLGVASLLVAISFAASAQTAFTTRSVNVRSGPDTTYPPVAVLAPGAPVQVMGCLDDWSWCDVVFGDNRGWTYAPYLNYDYQGARVPFYSYAPAFGIPIVTFALGSYWDRYYRGRDFYGRRDYWSGRSAPVHVRPAGPPPRASIPSSFRGHTDNRGSDHREGGPGFNGNHGDNRAAHDVNVPSRGGDHRGTQGTPGFKPAPTVAHPQEMHRGAPAAVAHGAQSGAPQSHGPQGAPPSRGAAPQGHAPQGNAGHSNEHGKEEGHH